MVFTSLFLTMTGENQIWPACVRLLTVWDHDCYSEKDFEDFTGLSAVEWFTPIEKPNVYSKKTHLCLSSHEDAYIFHVQQTTIFTATLIFQPQSITTMYVQLQMIEHINICCFTHRQYFIHNIVVRCIRHL